MAYLDHVRALNGFDPASFQPFALGDRRVGWVRPETARALGLEEAGGQWRLKGDESDPTAALAAFAQRAEAAGRIKRKGELYPVLTRWGEAPLAVIDRAAVPMLGLRAYGIHVNGFVRGPGGLELWVGRRAMDRDNAPGKLDHIVAGGQPHGLTLAENLAKEAWEEAGLDPLIAATAQPVGAISYAQVTETGLKPDTMFCFDLELPAGVTPKNRDGEVAQFERWPVERVAETVRGSDRFKPNVNLVLIDFLIRHGVLTPDEPDYLGLVEGLHARLP